MTHLKEWSLESNAIEKTIDFSSFKQAIDFINKLAEIAEKHNHHPSLLLVHNTLRITLTTHKENSLTETDFEVAEEIDRIEV